MRTTKLLIGLALAFCAARPARGLDQPKRSTYDAAIRYVNYNPEDVVEVTAVIGIATHIVLEEGEEYVTHAFGDAKAWQFSHKLNHVFVKATAEDADTNLVIVTDRRNYNFHLRFVGNRVGTPPLYQLVFRYPDTAARKKEDAAVKHALETQGRGDFNLAYTMIGDTALAPVNAWDNGEFTTFKFEGNVDLPTIYMVDQLGNESIVERHVTGPANNRIVMHKVAAKWILRLQDQALIIYNEAYKPTGVENTTGTASPAVQRSVKGE